MKTIKLTLLIILSIGIISCEKTEEDSISEMKFQELDGTDCGLLLTLELDDEWRSLEALNLAEFDITPSNGLEVFVSFKELENEVSGCEFAEPINLLSISVK